MDKESLKGHLSVLGAVVLFGMMSPISKLAFASGHVDAYALATFRVSGAALLFFLLSFAFPKQRVRRKDWLPLLGMSLCGMAVNQYLYIIGIQYTSPVNGCVIASSTPVFTLLLSALVLHEPISWRKGCGLAVAASGALMLVLTSASLGGRAGNPLGDALCLVSQMMAALYFVLFGRLLRRYHPVQLMKWLFGISAVLTLPFFAPHLYALPWAEMTRTDYGSCLYVVLGGTFFSYLLLIVAQRRLLPSVAASYNYVQPAVAALLAISLGLDAMSWSKAVAMFMIMLGVWQITRVSSVRAAGEDAVKTAL